MTTIRNEIPRIAQPGEAVALDIEMFGQESDKLHRPTGNFACLSIQFDGEDEVYQIYSVDQITPTLENLKDAEWVLHNALYDFRQLRRFTNHPTLWPTATRRVHDTMLMEKVLWGGYYSDFRLNDLARRYFDLHMEKETREQFELATEMTEQMKQYAAYDVTVTLMARKKQLEIASSSDLRVYYTIDMPMIWVVLDMQPVKVNVERWAQIAPEFEKRGREIEAELGVNVMSPIQVKAFLEKHRINVDSTAEEVLEEYEDRDFVAKILEARKNRTASSKYGEKWLSKFVEDGGLVYADWKITTAETGRMSCSNPPLQGIPVRKLPLFRELFIPQNDIIYAPDVSQQEPRILGYLSQDKNLLKAFESNESIHVYVARMLYNDPTIEKGEDWRYKDGKAISLGISYGLTPKGTAKKTGHTIEESEKLIRTYFDRFPDVENYIVQQRTKAMRKEYVETVSGRRIWLNMHNFQWENNAINAPIQGSAADFTKVWGAEIWRRCKSEGIPFPVTMFIHDEIVMDVKKEYFDDIQRINTEAVQEAAKLFPGIPFVFDGNYGDTWACHK